MPDANSSADPELYFNFFNEIGILAQLGQHMFEARLPKGFLVSHFSVLNSLIRVKDGRTPFELAKAFQVPKTTMTHTLSVLLKHNLVREAVNPLDGRSKCIWLTDEGRAFRENAIKAIEPDFRDLAKLYPLAKVKPMLPNLQEIRRIMDTMRHKN